MVLVMLATKTSAWQLVQAAGISRVRSVNWMAELVEEHSREDDWTKKFCRKKRKV